MRRIVLLLALMAAGQASAGVYKWVDEKGRVHYGEQPPQAAQSSEMRLEKAPPPDPYAEERRARLMKSMETADEERAKQNEQRAEAKKDEEMRKRNCSAAKSQLHTISAAAPVFRMDENGNRQYLSDEKRAAEKQQAEAEVKKWCR